MSDTRGSPTADLAGQRILGWAPRGKHLLMRTDAGITVHSHLRMSGRWTVLGAGRRLPRTVAARLRIALRLHDDRTLAGIDLPVLTLVRTGDESRVVGHLGPDLLAASTSTDEGLAHAAARVVAAGTQPVVAALLDQRRVAGLGNMWAQELLFLHGVDPWRPASAVDPAPLLADARPRFRHAVDHDPSQNTTGRRSPRHWVYGRARRPCLRCATPIAFTEAARTAWTRDLVVPGLSALTGLRRVELRQGCGPAFAAGVGVLLPPRSTAFTQTALGRPDPRACRGHRRLVVGSLRGA